MPLSGHCILIVENRIESGVLLQSAIDRAGAESLVVPDPHTAAGQDRLRRFVFTGAAIHTRFRKFAVSLDVPVVFYGEGEGAPQVLAALIKALR